MTLTPEQRAASLCNSWDTLDMAEFERAIAQAITQAQDEKLEEAARVADDAQAEADSCSSRVVEEEIVAAAVSEGCAFVAASIRNLKSQKD